MSAIQLARRNVRPLLVRCSFPRRPPVWTRDWPDATSSRSHATQQHAGTDQVRYSPSKELGSNGHSLTLFFRLRR